MTALAIVGNGFDRAMGLPSGLDAFNRYVAATDALLHERIERHLPLEGQWWNIEELLQYFDAEEAIEDAAQHLVGYGADDWSDSYHHNVQDEAELIAAALSHDLRNALSRWVSTLDAVPIHKKGSMPLGPGTRYLNFNYTMTLQRAFKIPDARVLHIHGQGHRGDPLVLGHARPVVGPKPLALYGNEDDDVRIVEAAQILDGALDRSAKRSNEIIMANQVWFRSLAPVSAVYVLGHSLAAVDHPYFQEVASNVVPHAMWHVSCHSSEDHYHAADLMSVLGINPSHWNTFDLARWIVG